MFYYSVTIFESAGLSKQGSQYASIGAGGINLLITIIAIPLVNHCGRRKLALASCWTAAVCLVVLCISITYIVSLTDVFLNVAESQLTRCISNSCVISNITILKGVDIDIVTWNSQLLIYHNTDVTV